MLNQRAARCRRMCIDPRPVVIGFERRNRNMSGTIWFINHATVRLKINAVYFCKAQIIELCIIIPNFESHFIMLACN